METMAASSPALSAPRAGVDRRGMTVMACGHALADACQGAVPALLPFLIAKHGWSYAAASALVLGATLSSSIVQPLFGVVADRRALGRLLPLGVLLAGTGIALVGVAPGYALTFLAVLLSGLGVAAFHPEGSRFANYLSGARRATGMSLFSVGGNAGFALGPLLVTPLVVAFGLPGVLLMAVPAALVAAWVAAELPRLERFRPPPGTRAGGGSTHGREDRAAFVRLNLVIVARTFAYFGLVTFVPLYSVAELGASRSAGNLALTVYLAGGAVGTLLGGPLADRLGRRPVVVGALALLCPLVLAFLAAPHALGLPLLFVCGMATIATFSVTVVMGQEYLPGRIGLASGITLGLSIGLGGVGASLLGLLADAAGLHTTMLVVAFLPLVGVALALTLPK
jgi:FSR family fosmidomycin resistance protein-like MFS transporter